MTTTISTLPNAYVTYTITVPFHQGLFYVGCCKLSDITRLPDARRNSEFVKHIKKTDAVSLAIMTFTTDEAAAEAMRDNLAGLAWCNAHGAPVVDLPRVRCVETGIIYDSASAAARAMSVSRQAMSQNLNAEPHDRYKIKGFTFERVS